MGRLGNVQAGERQKTLHCLNAAAERQCFAACRPRDVYGGRRFNPLEKNARIFGGVAAGDGSRRI